MSVHDLEWPHCVVIMKAEKMLSTNDSGCYRLVTGLPMIVETQMLLKLNKYQYEGVTCDLKKGNNEFENPTFIVYGI